MQYAQPPHRVFPFRWIFPLGQFVLCLLLVSIVMELRPYIPYIYAARVGEAIAAMNLPGALFQVPVAFLFPDHQIWTPPLLSFQLWHGVTLSIFAVLFWWIAGRATEALVAIDDRQLIPKIGWGGSGDRFSGHGWRSHHSRRNAVWSFSIRARLGIDSSGRRRRALGTPWIAHSDRTVSAVAIHEKAQGHHLRDRL
jgi:hypothetical protein